MKAVIEFTLCGVETAVSENIDYLLGVLDPGILDETSIDIHIFTEEELEK